MSTTAANLWDSDSAREIANKISRISGIYCGPASIGWIAAVWNLNKEIPYDYQSRLSSRGLFSDGPRTFKFKTPLPSLKIFGNTLNDILQRETNNELGLSNETYYKYKSIHEALNTHQMPLILRLKHGSLIDGLHYVTIYKSEIKKQEDQVEKIRFYWQDNGIYGRRNDLKNPGLYIGEWQDISWKSVFIYGAKRVVIQL